MKLLRAVEEEGCKDAVSCEHLTELLSMLAAKKENLLKLILLKDIEEETTTDEREADIIKTVDYDDNFILPLENQCDEDEWEEASNSELEKLAPA